MGVENIYTHINIMYTTTTTVASYVYENHNLFIITHEVSDPITSKRIRRYPCFDVTTCVILYTFNSSAFQGRQERGQRGQLALGPKDTYVARVHTIILYNTWAPDYRPTSTSWQSVSKEYIYVAISCNDGHTQLQ